MRRARGALAESNPMSMNPSSHAAQIVEAILAAETRAPKGEVFASLPWYLMEGIAKMSAPLLQLHQAPVLSLIDPRGAWSISTLAHGDLLVCAFSDHSTESVYAPRLLSELVTSPETKFVLAKEIVYVPWNNIDMD